MITTRPDTRTAINPTRFSRVRAFSSTARTLCTSVTRATGQPGSKLRFDGDHHGYGDHDYHDNRDDQEQKAQVLNLGSDENDHFGFGSIFPKHLVWGEQFRL